MPETIQSFFSRVADAASKLDDQPSVELVNSVRGHLGSSKLRLLILGSIGSGRSSLANLILGQPELLPISPIPKKPLSLNISQGEHSKAEALTRLGTKQPITNANLRSFLTNAETDLSKYISLDIKASSDLLDTSELKLETISSDKSATDWKEILAAADYILLVLKATALLSEQEKRFLRDILHPYFGLERVAIVINQIDLVEEEERESVAERVRTFLGNFESQPLLLQLSASQSLKRLGSEDEPVGSGQEALMSLIKEDLVEKYSTLKLTAVEHAAKLCLSHLEEEAGRQNALLNTSDADLEKINSKFNKQDSQIQERIGRMQHRSSTYIQTLLREQFFRDVEGFSNAMREQLPAEIMAVQDVSAIKKNIMAYMEALWTEFFNARVSELRGEIMKEIRSIERDAETDLEELLEDQMAELKVGKLNFDPTPGNMRSFLMPKRGDSKAGSFATSLQLGGVIMLMVNLPLALGALGAGQVVRMLFHKDMAQADKKAISESAIGATHELEIQIKRQVEIQFEAIDTELKKMIADMYNAGIDSVQVALKSNTGRRQDLQHRQEQIQQLVEVTLPELKTSLQRLIMN